MRIRASKRKLMAEYGYWRARSREAAVESGAGWYEWVCTEHFGLSADFYAGKRLLDVGCGPRGSLEWAGAASERVGLDPLADRYRELWTVPHATTYVAAGAEAMPLAGAHFDVVSCVNALDHVDDVAAVIGEIGRVARHGATLLLIVDIGHGPTEMEPHRLDWDLLGRFEPDWKVVERRDFERPSANMLANLQAARPFDHEDRRPRAGVLSVRLVRA